VNIQNARCNDKNKKIKIILNLCSSLNARDQVSHPYKTTGKITVLCILKFMFLDGKLEDRRFCTE
jgi:hypothetical protein